MSNTTFMSRMVIGTRYGRLILPVFKYNGIFDTTSETGPVLLDHNDTLALSGYSTSAAMSVHSGLQDPVYGSIGATEDDICWLFNGEPEKYNFKAWEGALGSETIAVGYTITTWRTYIKHDVSGVDNREGMYGGAMIGQLSEDWSPAILPSTPLKIYGGKLACMYICYVDNNNMSFILPVIFAKATGMPYDNRDLEIYNTVVPDQNQFGVCSIYGHIEDNQYAKIQPRLLPRDVTLMEFDELCEDFGMTEYTEDPYGKFDRETGREGLDGTGEAGGVNIGVPDLPSVSAANTGFITLYNPSMAQLQSLSAYMWSGAFDMATYRKIFADPMDCILGLSIVPVAVPNGGAQVVKVGNISTGVSLTKAASQYVTVNCGSLDVSEYWGAYLDYGPYTKCELYLPYIGIHPLNIEDVMNKTVSVTYHVDILTGACIAFVSCNGTVLYQYMGQCAESIPVAANDWTNAINGALSIAASIGTMVATGGASAPASAANIMSASVNQMKPSIEKSGSLGGSGCIMGVQKPYLIITRPKQAVPLNQNKYTGYPSFITRRLGSLSGYTEVYKIHLDNIPCTTEELGEIETLLKKGVIL